MAASNVSANIEKSERGGSSSISNSSPIDTTLPSSTMKSENYMILSTTYALNNSDTKRIHVGLRISDDGGTFEPAIKLTGNTGTGIYFDRDSWTKFRDNMELGGSYLRGMIVDAPKPILINDVIMHFTTSYGARAILLSYQQKREAENIEVAAAPAKKRKIFTPTIVMQKTTFEGLEAVLLCVNLRYEQLRSLASVVSDCARFLTKEIELNLPKGSVNEKVVKQTFVERYSDITQNVRRQITNLEFLDNHFEIVFQELASIHFNEIVKTVIAMINATL